jgi:hypothetical protein
MSELADLYESANLFFSRHWKTDILELPTPTWVGPYRFEGPVPEGRKGGCYALFRGSNLVYVGVGSSKGSRIYPEHGITRRLMSHVMRADSTKGKGRYAPLPRWSYVTEIHVIGFPSEQACLAYALEDFLIGKLNPVDNRTKKRES